MLHTGKKVAALSGACAGPIIQEGARGIPGIPHPIPYQGSKRQLAPLIVKMFPPETDTLIEPFAGSGAVSIAAAYLGRAKAFRLSDVDGALMALWDELLFRPERLVNHYRRLWHAQRGNERSFYDGVRLRFNAHRKPGDFLYLLARCVKAAIRYNSRGEFNNSPDNRRLGALPDTMARHIRGVSRLLSDCTTVWTSDYKQAVEHARPTDLVYMDPPYQGVCLNRDSRYVASVDFDQFVRLLADLNARKVPFIVSYDGRTGTKTYGRALPSSLRLGHIEVRVGRSTQATLLGRELYTYESLYLSPALLARNAGAMSFGEHSEQQLALFE